jgi:hypothetical protein
MPDKLPILFRLLSFIIIYVMINLVSDVFLAWFDDVYTDILSFQKVTHLHGVQEYVFCHKIRHFQFYCRNAFKTF